MVRTCAAASLVLLLACGGKPPPSTATNPPAPTAPPTPPPALTPDETLARFADRSCACADAACATEVSDDLATWIRGHKKELEDAKDDDARRSGERMFKCLSDHTADMTKLMDAVAEAQQERREQSHTGENDAIAGFANQACDCKDKECGTKVADAFAGWLLANKNARGDEEAAAKHGERMFKCLTAVDADMTKLMDAAKEVSK